MNNEKSSTICSNEKMKTCIKKIVVTDKFKTMMEEALRATYAVLKRRQKDVLNWNAHKNEFYRIFGVRGKQGICHKFNMYNKILKIREEEVEFTTAQDFMTKSLERMIVICEALYVGEQREVLVTHYDDSGIKKEKKLNVCGSFINMTEDDEYSAFVLHDQTWNKEISEYRNLLKINIGQNFVCKRLMGASSKVSTLCHEISHFDRFGFSDDVQKGAMGGWGLKIYQKERILSNQGDIYYMPISLNQIMIYWFLKMRITSRSISKL